MRLFISRPASLAIALAACALGGCSGNLGTGSGLSIPQTQQAQGVGPPGGVAGAQSRQRTLDGAVLLTTEMTVLPLPSLDGFAVNVELGAAPPSPSPTPLATPAASGTPARGFKRRRTKLRALVVAVNPSAAPSAAASLPAAPGASGSPAPTLEATPNAAAAPSRATAPAGRASGGAVPAASPSAAAQKTTTKLVVFPEDAPAAPTPQPSGNVQTYPVRKALVRGVVKSAGDVALYGLAAIKFTIPADEDVLSRGYTVALFSAGKRHHDTLVASDARAQIAAHVVSSAAQDALVLKRNTTYLLVLYADERAAAPGAVPSGYPSPGVNPIATPATGIATPISGTPSPSPASTFLR